MGHDRKHDLECMSLGFLYPQLHWEIQMGGRVLRFSGSPRQLIESLSRTPCVEMLELAKILGGPTTSVYRSLA